MKELQNLIKRVEVEINKTATGELRNLLCDTNIMLQKQVLNLPVVSGSCFWKHNWGKWEQFEKSMTHVKYGGSFVEMHQKRICKNCGKRQEEYISG